MKRFCTALLMLGLGAGAVAAPVLRDPFARPPPSPLPAGSTPAGTAAAVEATPQLRAIMYEAAGTSLVNISGRIMAVGERFGHYQLVKIQERSVMLSKGGVKRVLALDGETEK
jgi:hypothetical protein